MKSYCGQTQTAKPENKNSLFIIVTIGKASQFFEYSYGQSQLHCFHPLDLAYEFKKDCGSVDQWCTYIRDPIKTNHD